jgi:steroid delta-isomerase-like uncharacterized protein
VVESNSMLARRWMDEVWNKRLEKTIDEMLPEGSLGHSYGNPSMQGPQAFRQFRDAFVKAVPELRMEVQDTVEQGDNVAVRWRVRGVHRGQELGIAATDETLDFWGITWLRFSNGRIAEGWDAWNQGAVMQQLNVAAAKKRGVASA